MVVTPSISSCGQTSVGDTLVYVLLCSPPRRHDVRTVWTLVLPLLMSTGRAERSWAGAAYKAMLQSAPKRHRKVEVFRALQPQSDGIMYKVAAVTFFLAASSVLAGPAITTRYPRLRCPPLWFVY